MRIYIFKCRYKDTGNFVEYIRFRYSRISYNKFVKIFENKHPDIAVMNIYIATEAGEYRLSGTTRRDLGLE